LAGNIPKKSPIETETKNPTRTDHEVTVAGRGVAVLIRKAIPKPINIPRIPPVPVTKMASIRNCFRISEDRAPIAFRMPISLVRSLTETSIIFMTPIPPTSKPMEEINIMTRYTAPVIWL
jgi:hypothetical protein